MVYRILRVVILSSIAATSIFAAEKTGFKVGVVSSMESVRPRSGYVVNPASSVNIRLSRDEYESVQVLVEPVSNALKDVRVTIDMEHSGFASSNITVALVGYVLTKDVPKYKVRPSKKPPEPAWWPDPILDFQKSTDIALGDVQSFWVRVKCPKNQKAGVYEGSLKVSADGAEEVRIPFSVRVNNFAVNRAPPLPLLVSCYNPNVRKNSFPKNGRNNIAKRIAASEYHHAWETRKERYCDFLSDYYLSWGAPLYLNAKSEPDWEMLVRLKKRGRLSYFNLCYWWYMGLGEGAEEKWVNEKLPVFRARYEKAKSLGLSEHAVLYGCDELNPNVFTNIARTVKAIHKHLPGVKVITTARDYKFGVGGSPLSDVDMFCPIISKFKKSQVRLAREAGRKVWWCICCDPCYPWPNTLIECPPAETRSLMGAMTQKYKPDGFLYYATMTWNSEEPITKGPFTKWEPKSFSSYHGDGQWTSCGGPDNMPLATLRLENFRDGLEDLWYCKLLEDKVREVEKGEVQLKVNKDEWLEKSRELLAVPKDVVNTTTSFSVNPKVIYEWRDAIADLIE